MYLFAFAIGAATLIDAWELHPPWLRVVAIVVGHRGGRLAALAADPSGARSGSASGRSRS